MSEPLLYLSLYLKRHRAAYYELLDRVRRTGDWEAWLAFFLEGLRASHFVALPSSFDIHEWEIMRRFCGAVESSPLSEELLDAIHGSGAFRMFRATIYRHEIQDD